MSLQWAYRLCGGPDALKFLPDIFSGDPERLARFEREAKLLASLNHPNIATIYGLEQADGKRFLAMELVEGETLAQQIERGPLPVDEALQVCRQIAEGLEAAHEKGVIHRDLKPANVKITPEGKVKVLDFGLAKAFQGEAPAADASKSPTLTDQMTRPGVILGTAAYMAPEQAKGRAVDKRADIWAFGCILYECLTGRRPFYGETITETLAAIIRGEPDWTTLPAETPLNVRTMLRRCLQKDAGLRLRDIADARIEIFDVCSGATGIHQAAGRESARWRALPWTVAVVVMIIAAVFALRSFMLPDRPQQPTIRSVIPLPEPMWLLDSGNLAISPDGRQIAYVAGQSHKTRIYCRSLSEGEFKEIPGTEGGNEVFFSPDGHWIAYQSDESGQMQIHVAKYPDKSIKIQISQDGGIEPHWVGRELFYLSGRTLKAAMTNLIPTLKAGKPIELFALDQSFAIQGVPPWGGYSVMPDGQKFLFIKRSQPVSVTQLNLVTNWFEELKRLCPTGKK